MARPTVTLIAVVSADGFISRDRGVPWDLPRDRAFFRAQTAGHWLLLGRRTYLEMVGWFTDHTPLVLSPDPHFHPDPGRRVATVAEALELTEAAGVTELMVVGGSQAFQLAMPYASQLLITRVRMKLGDGVPFPPIAPSVWHLQSCEVYPPDDQHAYALEFLTLTRASPHF